MALRLSQIVLFFLLSACAPVMAATIDLVGDGSGLVTVTVTSDGAPNIVGLALDIEVDSGAVVTDVSIDTPCFNIFPDSAYIQGGAYTYGAGTPVADKTFPGEISLPQNSFTLCLGCLNGASTPGADGAAAVQFTLALDMPATVCVSENAVRGGIVAVDGSSLDAATNCGFIIPPCHGSCWTGDAASCLEFESLGAPDCWCSISNPRQCHGDANGGPPEGKLQYHVSTLDLGILLDAWNKPIGSLTGNQICADFDRQPEGKLNYRVSTVDLGILLNNWNIPDGPAPDCMDAFGIQ